MHPWVELFGLKIPTYLLIISASYCIGLFYLFKRAQKYPSTQRSLALDLSLIIMISGFVGARLSHVFWEHWDYYQEDLFRVLEIWQGGYVFYGGAILSGLFAVLYLKVKKQNPWPYLDLFAPILVLVYALGRLSCLMAGCCFGRACELPWAIIYPAGVEAPHGIALHPTPLYASLWAFSHFLILFYLEKKPNPFLRKTGDLFLICLFLHGIGRLGMEYFRADFRGSTILGISLSSFISLLLILFSIYKYNLKRDAITKR